MISLEENAQKVLDLLVKKNSFEKEELKDDCLDILSLCISAIIESTYNKKHYEDVVNDVFSQVKEDLGICVKP